MGGGFCFWRCDGIGAEGDSGAGAVAVVDHHQGADPVQLDRGGQVVPERPGASP